MRKAPYFCSFVYLVLAASLQAEKLNPNVFPTDWEWTSVNDEMVTTEGKWIDDRFRFADAAHKYTTEDGACLRWRFVGKSVAVRLAGQNTSSYPGTGLPSHGKLSLYIDGELTNEVYSAQHGREVVAANNLSAGPHELKLVHSTIGDAAGLRIEGFITSSKPIGLFFISVTGELQEYMNDARFVVSQNGKIVRSAIGRNWLTGSAHLCLPSGNIYDVRIKACGWTAETVRTPRIIAAATNESPPVYLRRTAKTSVYRFRYPRLNDQAIRRGGESFNARFLGFDTEIKEVRIRRQQEDATFTRVLKFTEDRDKAFYYDRQININIPAETPLGVYDLEIDIVGGRRTSTCRSPTSVVVVNEYPENPKFITFGHLDTSGQFQAEYLQRLASMANIIGADMVLASNCVNAAYVSGALSNLQMPYLVNFGNHQVYGHHRWYGSDLGGVTIGPDIFVLNFGLPWHEPIEPVIAALEKNRSKAIKIINAFENNAPDVVLDQFKIAMIHDAHGPGDKLMEMGNTPTQRVGKTNSVSFRVVQFENGKVASATYAGHETAPIPFERDELCPLRIEVIKPLAVRVINEYRQAFSKGRVSFVVPNGRYLPTAGQIISENVSDNKKLVEVIVENDIPASSETTITLLPQ